jgi:antitoxin ChpS
MEATVTLSSKNQIVVPKSVRQRLGIGPGDQLILDLEKERLILRPKPKNYAKCLRGLHRDVWKDTETGGYVEGERNSWEEK